MGLYRNHLPQLDGEIFISDGGLETTLLFLEGIELPSFCAFPLLYDAAGTAHLRRQLDLYADIARRYGVGVVLESATWRASRDWGEKLGYDPRALAAANRKAIDLLLQVREEFESDRTKVVISGNIGPRGDGYTPSARMTAAEAKAYHAEQIEVFADTGADMVAAFTMNYVEEAEGIAEAAKAVDMPVAISFTVETDGRLPSGDSLQQAIEHTDASTGNYPVYYMLNCAHPAHFCGVLAQGGQWLDRMRGIRANASRKSHAELDNSTELDIGDPTELGQEYRTLRSLLPRLAVVGGCCGTDHRHIESICAALAS